MELLGRVSTEGGPLLLVDLEAANGWSGIESDDYDQLCQRLESTPSGSGVQVTIGGHEALAWDIPTGTAHVWRRSADELVLSRAWADTDAEIQALAAKPTGDVDWLGEFDVRSGWLLIMWAPESGCAATITAPTDGVALDLSVGQAALVAALPGGRYRCVADHVGLHDARSVRCAVLPRP